MSSTPGIDPDLTRKQRREQARAQRRAMEEAQKAGAQRRRLMQLGGIVGVVVAIIVIILVATSGGGAHKLKKTETGSALPHATEVQARFAGIPQKGIELGSPTAPVTLQEFADLQCPFCRQYTTSVFPVLVSKYVRTGKLRMEFHNFDIIGPDSIKASKMAEAAGQQNLLWNYADLFYNNQQTENSGYVTDEFLTQIAGGVKGLNVQKALSERFSPAVEGKVNNDNQLARVYGSQYANLPVPGFNGTPSFLLYKTGTTPQLYSPNSLTEPAVFEAAINKLLKG
ncbi:MAG TPA: thioredoxin domain-containing protein [Solirubrobacteraceae bacterium]|jgi:protein-disulfide isomerase|nr:thioredoxin domain-containing protein [Solirubrobacteraceae bacterium]